MSDPKTVATFDTITGGWRDRVLKEPSGTSYAMFDVRDYHWTLVARVRYPDGSEAVRSAVYYDGGKSVKMEDAESRASGWMRDLMANWRGGGCECKT